MSSVAKSGPKDPPSPSQLRRHPFPKNPFRVAGLQKGAVAESSSQRQSCYGAEMVFVLMFVCLLGGFTTIAALWSEGWRVAFLCAPLGGSGATLMAALLIASLRTDEVRPSHQDPETPLKTVT